MQDKMGRISKNTQASSINTVFATMNLIDLWAVELWIDTENIRLPEWLKSFSDSSYSSPLEISIPISVSIHIIHYSVLPVKYQIQSFKSDIIISPTHIKHSPALSIIPPWCSIPHSPSYRPPPQSLRACVARFAFGETPPRSSASAAGSLPLHHSLLALFHLR